MMARTRVDGDAKQALSRMFEESIEILAATTPTSAPSMWYSLLYPSIQVENALHPHAAGLLAAMGAMSNEFDSAIIDHLGPNPGDSGILRGYVAINGVSLRFSVYPSCSICFYVPCVPLLLIICGSLLKSKSNCLSDIHTCCHFVIFVMSGNQLRLVLVVYMDSRNFSKCPVEFGRSNTRSRVRGCSSSRLGSNHQSASNDRIGLIGFFSKYFGGKLIF